MPVPQPFQTSWRSPIVFRAPPFCLRKEDDQQTAMGTPESQANYLFNLMALFEEQRMLAVLPVKLARGLGQRGEPG